MFYFFLIHDLRFIYCHCPDMTFSPNPNLSSSGQRIPTSPFRGQLCQFTAGDCRCTRVHYINPNSPPPPQNPNVDRFEAAPSPSSSSIPAALPFLYHPKWFNSFSIFRSWTLHLVLPFNSAFFFAGVVD